MRGWIVGMLLIGGCGDDGSTAIQCADLAAEQEACMPPAAIDECEATVAACGGGNVVVLESCPLQFTCDR